MQLRSLSQLEPFPREGGRISTSVSWKDAEGEMFNVPATNVAIRVVLSSYASERETGIEVDSGKGMSDAGPISKVTLRPTPS